MNNYEDWARLVARKLRGDADLIAAIDKEELDDAAARDAFCSAVLEPFLPENFGIGSGRIVDAFGNYSDHLDLIIYNRDFPRIGLRGTNAAYLYESVLATFSVRAKFLRKTFFESMDACASMANLDANIDKTVLVRLAKKNGLTLGPNKKFVHRDPLHTSRFDLIGRPPAFIFGFTGIKNSYRQLQENVELWIKHRQEAGEETEMKALPAVIATQGVFAWRNAAPLALSNREMLGIGNDDAPIRLIVLQLLYLLNRRLNVTADGYGLKPNLKAYLSQFSPPKFEVGVGNVAEVLDMGQKEDDKPFTEKTRSSLYVPAEDRAQEVAEATPAPAPEPEPKPVAKAPPPAAKAPEPKPVEAAPPAPEPEPVEKAPEPVAAEKPAEPAPAAVEFDKPSPFASAPKPPAEEEPTAPPLRSPAPIAPLGSAPIPMAGADDSPMPVPEMPADPEPEPEVASAPPTAPLGSAPIPPMEKTAESKVIPPKPPVDIEFGATDAAAEAEDSDGPEESDFEQTVVIPPPNAAEKKTEPPRNSTDAFIARVKEQLSASDSKQNTSEQDAFTSTIPQ